MSGNISIILIQTEEEVKRKRLKRCRQVFGKQTREQQNKQTAAQHIFLTFLTGFFTLHILQSEGDTREKTSPKSAADPPSTAKALDRVTLPRTTITLLQHISAFISKPKSFIADMKIAVNSQKCSIAEASSPSDRDLRLC